jgi:tetratricopeptide (TPR) repeat protein
MSSASPAASSQAARLAALLASDPDNASLLAAAATAAHDEGDSAGCLELLHRHAAAQPWTAQLWNLKGLAALSASQIDEAADAFVHATELSSDAAIRFNLAYARAMQGGFGQVLELTADPQVAAIPGAAALRMRAMHHLGQLDAMVALGQQALETTPDAEIAGLLATGLFDAGDLAQARQVAPQALQSSDGCAVAGMLALDEGEQAYAMQLFAQALAMRPQSGRALLGQGIGLLNAGELPAAAQTLERASRSLGSHPGAWVATGWAYLLQGEHDQALACFERALETDRGFSEAAGGLAVTCISTNDLARARHYAEVALRLDRDSLSGRYAQSLLLAHEGDTDKARAMYDQTLRLPIGSDQRTIATALIRRAGRSASD